LLVLRGFSSDRILLLPSGREAIVHGLFTAWGAGQSGGILTSVKLPGAAAEMVSRISGNIRLMRRHRALPSATIASQTGSASLGDGNIATARRI
jgi:hypothetical protein